MPVGSKLVHLFRVWFLKRSLRTQETDGLEGAKLKTRRPLGDRTAGRGEGGLNRVLAAGWRK